MPPLAEWRRTGATLGITVDGAASNDRGSMLLEGQLAWHLQRVAHVADAITPRETLELMTEAPARMLGWRDLGRLKPGAPADLAVVDLRSLELAGAPAAGGDPVDRLFRTYAGGRVRHLLVGDRVAVEEGRLTGVDEASVAIAASASADRLYGPHA